MKTFITMCMMAALSYATAAGAQNQRNNPPINNSRLREAFPPRVVPQPPPPPPPRNPPNTNDPRIDNSSRGPNDRGGAAPAE